MTAYYHWKRLQWLLGSWVWGAQLGGRNWLA